MVFYKEEILCIVLPQGIFSFNCHSSVFLVDIHILFKELGEWNMNLGMRRGVGFPLC